MAMCLLLSFWGYRASAAELMDGFVVSIDRAGKIVTVRDSVSGENRSIAISTPGDVGNIKPGSHIRLWVSTKDNGVINAEKICTPQLHDMTGIKKRLRKATGSRHKGMRGHRGRGHGRGHGR